MKTQLLLVTLGFLCSLPAGAAEPFYLFAPDGNGRQLLSLLVEPGADRVEIHQQGPLSLPWNPSGVVAHRAGTRLIVTSPGGGGEGPSAADVSVDAAGNLSLVGTSTLKFPTGYTSIDRSGRFFLSSNYRDGHVDVYRIAESGSIGDHVCHVETPLKYSHCVLTTPDNRFAYIPCVKENNALFQYGFNQQTGKLTPLDPFDARPPAMFGPRHVAYHPTQPIAYFSNEQQLGVSVFEIGKDGQLAGKQHAVSMPRRAPYQRGKRGMHASDLVVTSDGEWLFLAVRDFVGDEDSLFTFRIEADGRLSQVARTLVGDIPWRLALSPEQKHLLVSETASKTLAIFQINADGSLDLAARTNWNTAARDMVTIAVR